MDKKILNIKNILRIIISILVIFSMLKSYSMAYSFEQFEQFLNACYDNNITTNAMNIYELDYARNNIYKITNYITQHNVDISEYTCFAIRNSNGSQTALNSNNFMEVWFFKTAPGFGYQDGGNGAYFDIYTNSGTFYITTTGFLYTKSPSWNNNYKCGIFENKTFDSNFKNCLTQQKWDPNEHPITPPFDFTPYNITTIDDYNILKFAYVGNTALGILGENEYYQLEVRLKESSLITLGTALFNENQECYYRDNALIVEDNTRILANTVYLSYYEPYYLEFTIWKDSSNYEINGHLYKFYPPNAVIENGQIVDPGSGDYTNQDVTINNQNFFTNLYNNMFTIESGEAKQIIDEYIAKTDISEYGLESGEKQILNVLTGEPSDFVISWNEIQAPNMGYNTQTNLIKSGSVNLSKLILTYDNKTYSPQNKEAILNVINVARTIMGYTIIVLVMANMWETLCRVLGIGVGMYEANEEEKARLETQVTVEEFNNLDNDRGYTVVTAYDPKTRNRRKYYTKK